MSERVRGVPALLMTLLGISAAHAQRADEDLLELDLVELMQVQVTAQRRVEDIRDVPMGITVLDGSKIEVFGAAGEDVRMLSARLPSLQSESSFGRTFPRFYIRGLGNTDFDLNASQPVSLVYDDVVQENPALKGYPLFDLEQVEMARGPQGTLFGRNSPAGVIKFDSVRPADARAGHVRLGFGRYATANLDAAFGGALGGGWAGRLSVLQQRRDDWVDNSLTPNTRDLEGYRESAVRGQLRYGGREGFEALINLHGRALDGNARVFRANSIRPGSNELMAGSRREQVSQDGRGLQALDAAGGSLRLRWDFEGFSLYSISGFEQVELFSRGDIDGGFGAVYFPPMGPGVIPFDAESAAAIPDHSQFTQEVRIETTDGGRLDWQAGLYYFDEQLTVEDFSYSSTFGAGAQNGHARQTQDNTAWAAFFSADYELGERLTLRSGLRYTDDRKDFVGERLVGPFGPPIAPIPVATSDRHVSWDISAVWTLNDRMNAYARVAEGFRAPSIQGRLVFADASLPSERLVSVADTETVVSWEVGLKGEFLDKRLRFGGGLFRYVLDNQQLTAVGGAANFNTLVNADQVLGRGLEFDLEAYLTDRLLLTAGYSYNDTRIDDADLTVAVCGAPCTVLDPVVVVGGARLARIDGNALPFSPRHVFNVTAQYVRPLAGGELFVFTDWAYRSAVNFFLYESLEFRGDPLLEGGLRVGFAWQDGRREIAFYGRNITDEVALIGGIDFNNLTGMLNEPRIWGLEFKAKF